MNETTKIRAPSFFISHGAGPFALLGADHQMPLVKLCEETRWVLDGAKGVILVTAHWVTDQPHISSGANPELYFDYLDDDELPGPPLPKEAWEFEYKAPGDPTLAKRIKDKLDADGFKAVLDDERGWDHGVWVPMIMLRPQADLPVVQVSIPTPGPNQSENSFKLGKVLETFRDEGWVVLGSGSSYHNFNAVIASIMGVPGAPPIPDQFNRGFEDCMEKVAKTKDVAGKETEMLKWRETFPENEMVHPIGKEEHFMPFLVSLGAAGSDIGQKLGEWNLFGTIMTSFKW